MAYFSFADPDDLDRFCREGITGVDDFGRPAATGGVLIGQDPWPLASDMAELSADLDAGSVEVR